MGKTAAEFLAEIIRYNTLIQDAPAGSTGRSFSYIAGIIEAGASATFEEIKPTLNADTEGAEEQGITGDKEYDPEKHTNYALWSIIPPEAELEDTVSGLGLVGDAVNAVGNFFQAAGKAYAGVEKGTENGQKVRSGVNSLMATTLNPSAIYSGCSTKAMAEILDTGGWLKAEDQASWENLLAAVKTGGTSGTPWGEEYIELITAISGKGPAGEDTYGTSKLKGAEQSGWNPCSRTYNEGAFKEWVMARVAEIFENVLGDVINNDIRLEQAGLGNTLKKIVDDTAGLVGVDTGLYETEKEAEERANRQRKAIAAYSRVDNISFQEQCFLLSNVQAFAMINKGRSKVKPDNTAKGNASLMLQGDPFGLINKLTQNAHKEEFFEMPTAAISSLQPMIRLYKVVADENGENERQVEIKFDSHYSKEDAKDLLTNKTNRGHGVGISSFNFTYEANNPFAIKKSIRAKLVLHANSFSELLRDRNGAIDYSKNAPYAPPGKPVPYRYLDLAMKTWDPKGSTRNLDKINPQQRDVILRNMDKLTFRLKAVVGWANPSAKKTKSDRNTWATGTNGRITPNILDAVYDSCITLNLTPVIHTFDVDEMGRVKFSLTYYAYVEDFFDSPSFNIFTDPKVTLSQVERKARFADLNESCNVEEVNKIKNSEDETKAIEEEKVKNFRHLMNSLLGQKKMRFIEVPIEDLTKYRQGGPLTQLDSATLKKFADSVKTAEAGAAGSGAVAQIIKKGVDDAVAEVAEEKKKTTDPDDPGDDSKAKSGSTGTTPTAEEIQAAVNPLQTVPFFWVSDLMDVILKNVGTTLEQMPDSIQNSGKYTEYKEFMDEAVVDYKRFRANFARFRLVLGPLELINANVKGSTLQTAFVNLGDLPISAKYFMEFLTTKVLKTDKQEYSLPTFLNQFFNELITDFLNNDTCYGNRAKQKTRLSQAAITSYKKNPPKDNITAAMGSASRLDITNYSGEQLPILDVFGERGSPVSSKDLKDETNYMVYFAARTQPTDLMRGCKGGKSHKCYDDNGVQVLGDHDRGLWHYQIGKDRGIVKSIQLEKTDSPGLAEVRFEQEGYDGLAQLRVLYDAKIKTYLDVNAYPGSYIYIEPRGFDPGAYATDLTRMGIGGYYMIIRSTHTLGPGMAETEITAKWVAEIDKQLEEKEKDAKKKPKATSGKCYSASERKEAAEEGVIDSVLGFFGYEKKDNGTKPPE